MCFVLFHGYGAHRDLHSFPTRRSSDLLRLQAERQVADLVEEQRAAVGLLEPAEALLDRLDRKSTRLNSSHRTISYAVFCLKKKKHDRPSFGADNLLQHLQMLVDEIQRR